MLALEGLGRPHLHHDVIQLHGHLWRQTRQQWHMWHVGEAPGGANVLLLDVSFALERASASLEGDFTLFATQLGF